MPPRQRPAARRCHLAPSCSPLLLLVHQRARPRVLDRGAGQRLSSAAGPGAAQALAAVGRQQAPPGDPPCLSSRVMYPLLLLLLSRHCVRPQGQLGMPLGGRLVPGPDPRLDPCRRYHHAGLQGSCPNPDAGACLNPCHRRPHATSHGPVLRNQTAPCCAAAAAGAACQCPWYGGLPHVCVVARSLACTPVAAVADLSLAYQSPHARCCYVPTAAAAAPGAWCPRFPARGAAHPAPPRFQNRFQTRPAAPAASGPCLALRPLPAARSAPAAAAHHCRQ
mmetsp:Transcript_19822/g.43125  ORF Transcript_19822/g.43125 Transcript_19822/m.43125 type:complete len:278 (-) Transcript_19822:99-932(-)